MRIDPALREALGYHEALRRLGFKADDIYVRPFRNGGVQVVLRSQGKDFTMACGRLDQPASAEEFTEAWRAATTAWNRTMTDVERKVLFEEWLVRHSGFSLTMSLIEAGFTLDPRRTVS